MIEWQAKYDSILNRFIAGAITEDEAGVLLINECRFRHQALIAELKHFRAVKAQRVAA